MTNVNRRAYMERFRQDQKLHGIRRVSVTLSPHEYGSIRASATQYGERVTSHLKRRAFAHLDGQSLIPPDVGHRLDGLLAVLRGIGNNLNQLARHSNEMRCFLDTEQVRLHLKRMDEELRRFVSAPAPQDDIGGTP